MSQSQFALSWGSHTKNLSNGLSIFQQNGDFVDMTLAADGHFVKVHQVIIALSSPYIKELLASAPCPHPVLFFNNMTYATLSAILEYIYTGEVYVSTENLVDLKVAAKELCIKGLEDMNIPQSVTTSNEHSDSQNCQDMESNDSNMVPLDDNICYFEKSNSRMDEERTTFVIPTNSKIEQVDSTNEHLKSSYSFHIEKNNLVDNITEETYSTPIKIESDEETERMITPLQFTVSNQGSLQIILNRYVYYLKHTNRNNNQQWRCVDYLTNYKCPAHVITKNGVVSLRVSAHTHPFHDKRILKKLSAGSVYSAISEAQQQGRSIRNSKSEGIHESSE